MPSSADGCLRLPSSPDDKCGRREKPDKKRALEVRLVREVQVLNLNLFWRMFVKTSRHTVFANACMKAKKHAARVGREPCRNPKNRLSGHGGNAVMVQGARSRDPSQQKYAVCRSALRQVQD